MIRRYRKLEKAKKNLIVRYGTIEPDINLYSVFIFYLKQLLFGSVRFGSVRFGSVQRKIVTVDTIEMYEIKTK